MGSLAVTGLLIALLLLAFVGDLLQFAVRIAASIFGHPNLSTHMVSLSMLLHRFGMASGLLLIGFSIDRGVSAGELVAIYSILALLLGVVYLLVACFSTFSVNLLKPFVARYYHVDIPDRRQPHTMVPWRRPKADIAVVFLLSLCGFLLPSVAAATFPDYRATLLQTGFILNSVSTIYFALKVEKELAITLSSGNDRNKWYEFVNFMYARAIGSLITAAVLPLILFVF